MSTDPSQPSSARRRRPSPDPGKDPPNEQTTRGRAADSRQGVVGSYDLEHMALAIAEAEAARSACEVPIGAVIVDSEGAVIGRGHNRRERDQDPSAHAEMFAIREAAERLASWRLVGTTMYVTLEPCSMCAGALVLARVDRLVFGCRDPKAGAVRSLYELCEDPRLNHRLEIVEGVSAEVCSSLLSRFFADVRAGRLQKPSAKRELIREEE